MRKMWQIKYENTKIYKKNNLVKRITILYVKRYELGYNGYIITAPSSKLNKNKYSKKPNWKLSPIFLQKEIVRKYFWVNDS